MSTPYVLVLYYSRNGGTEQLAQLVALGIEQSGIDARLRTVPAVSPVTEATEPDIPDSGALYCSLDDLADCAGLVLGSPTRYGNMAAPLRYFWDQTSTLWLNGALVDKPAAVFSSTSTLHGGQESTLLSMMLPLLHHGMVIAGLPFTEKDLHSRTSSGSPYGATHLAGAVSQDQHANTDLTREEHRLACALGLRIATLALKLQGNP